jgi:hypothetical protein
MSNLEHALRELEIATAAVAALSLEDIERSRAILNRRSQALARLAGVYDLVLALSTPEKRETMSRLAAALAAGEGAQRQLAASKRGVTVEWSRWNRVHRALGERAAATRIDCRG